MSVPVPNPIPSPNDPVWSEEIASQPFNLTDIAGNVDTFTLSNFDDLFHDLGRSLVIFGVNMGMCITIAIVVLILTKTEKRRTPIFALNVAGLFLQFLRMLLSAIDYNGPNFTLEYQMLGENALLPNSANVPIYLYTFATIPWYIVIISSLILQVRVVFAAEPKAQKYLTWAVGFLGLAAITFNITGEVEVFKGNVEKVGVSAEWFPAVIETGRILYAITVGVASFVFVAKLMYLIHRRQKMGFKGFGPLQVIVIMGAQCLVVPLAFSISDFYVNIDGFVTIGQTFLTCSLPLSALWAAAEAEKHSVVQIKPSGTFGTSTSAGTYDRPISKKGVFNFWPGSKGTQGSVISEVEKGSFTEDSDHVMVQRTLQVVSSESPVPRSDGQTSYRY